MPNPNAGVPPLVGCPRLLIQYIRSYPPYLEAVSSIRNLRASHAVVVRGPLNIGVNLYTQNNTETPATISEQKHEAIRCRFQKQRNHGSLNRISTATRENYPLHRTPGQNYTPSPPHHDITDCTLNTPTKSRTRK
jgi:hypothetical protein